MTNVATDTAAAGSVISLPEGGGAVSGLGEKFSPDLFSGTGNFSVPIALPAGRAGLAPHLTLAYSTGAGNGTAGLGWGLSLPGVTRKTSKGVPGYLNRPGSDGTPADVFLLSGTEDLVPVDSAKPDRVRYRPRTEGLFARIEHVADGTGDYWEVRTRDGSLTRYGTARPAGALANWTDPAVIADPADPRRVFGWCVSETRDPLGNLVRYSYRRDSGNEPGHHWDAPLIDRISYADYGDRAAPEFMVTVEFEYEPRPDPHSDRRAGFELRTSLRCRTIRVVTHAADGVARVMREHRLSYEQAPFSGLSLLNRVDVVGIDAAAGSGSVTGPGGPVTEPEPATETLPPLTFAYSAFEPAGRRFRPLTGPQLPTSALDDPTLALIDLRGNGLPDIVDLGAVPRFWRNAGDGRFELPRSMAEAPPFTLGTPGVSVLDADGDGRADLMVSSGSVAGYFPMTFAGGWSRRSFQPYRQVPSVDPLDPGVRLVDLDGDGLTDLLQSGDRLIGWFNDADPRRAWSRTAPAGGSAPDVDLGDPRIRLADMTGDGLTDIVLFRSGSIRYWPNLGHNHWGEQVTMRHSPRLPDGYDPRRVLLGDLDGSGAADLMYVDDGRVLVWGNQSGNSWTEAPVTISGTPAVVDTDRLQLADLHGTGMAGVVFSRADDGSGRPHLWFLDLTGGRKPHLLERVDNNLGVRTAISYGPSTQEFLRDQAHPATRWRTTLPFPVHVVSRVEVTDAISGGRLTTGYRYHHGYWDGLEREFRGFAQVEQLDSETFDAAPGPGTVPDGHFSPPTLTRSWFHPGPVAAAEAGDWTELDLRHEYWSGDAPLLSRPPELTALLAGLSRLDRRSALRTMRGHALRTELYALDGTARADRPYTVTESLPGVRVEVPAPVGRPEAGVYFPLPLGQRTTQWERGTEPQTRFAFAAGFDVHGMQTGQLDVAVPRGRNPMATGTAPAAVYLTTYTTTEYAQRDDPDHYLVDRVARTTSREVVDDGLLSVPALRAAVLDGTGAVGVSLRLFDHHRTYYDGDAFTGLPLGMLGEHGLPIRVEALAFTDNFIGELFSQKDPAAVTPSPVYLAPGGVTSWPAEYPDEFRSRLAPLAGYRHYTDADQPGSPGGYYVETARHRYDVHDSTRPGRGLLLESLDPLGASTKVDYDEHDLLPVRSTDAAGLTVATIHDLRVLQPKETTDANGNTKAVTYSPAGFVAEQFLRGKDGTGDAVLPSTTVTRDLLAFAERGQPASIRTVRRVHRDTDTDIPVPERDEVLITVQYTDGSGRPVQTRAQAEDTLFGDPVFGGGVIPAADLAAVGDTVGRTRAPSDPDNVIVSGWQVYDNKGRVVLKYEPFFATGYDYAQPGDAKLGQRTVTFYDPRGIGIRTVDPDGSEHRLVLGVPVDLTDPDTFAPTPWVAFNYDANDNAGRTDPVASAPYRSHWNTPTRTEVDALGRTVSVIARTGPAPTDQLSTSSRFDIRGNLLSITDALGREAFRYVVDLANRRWRADNIDAGRRDTVLDAIGTVVEFRDSKGAVTLSATDVLHRPIRTWARDDAGSAVTLRLRTDYGDAGDPAQPAADRAAARALNLLGRPIRQYDEAGLVTTKAADLVGNILESGRRVVTDAAVLATYSQAATQAWRITPFRIDWTPRPGQVLEDLLLEPTTYVTTCRYDAVNRVTEHLFPTDVEGKRRVLRPTYNRAGELHQVSLDDTVHVRRISYDAKGRRALVALGNGVMTRYAYDPHTFRLVRQRSERYTSPDDVAFHPTGAPVADLGYDYDLVGNIRTIRDRTPGSGIRNNPDALGAADPVLRALLGSGDALDRRFDYDPIYRLVSATGREQSAPPAGDPWIDLPRGTDITLAQAYTEKYVYDAVGGMVTLEHAGVGGFTRRFTAGTGNRLLAMVIGKTQFTYASDPNGNLVGEATNRQFTPNHSDQLVAFGTQIAGAEPSVHVQFLYDPAGRRVKKLVRRQGGAVEVTHYVDGTFEHHRWTAPATGTAAGENNHVHVLDDRQRVALVRLGAAHPDDHGPAVAVHLADHLGSSTAVLDDTGAVTNREEYSPYGETTFGSFARKRYRFTGQERDSESGLAYHGTRYYAPWLARWTTPDPTGHPAGVNLFRYCGGNPLSQVDTSGRDFRAFFDFEHRTITISARYIVNTVAEERQLNSAIAAYNGATDLTYEGNKVVFNLQVRRIDYPLVPNQNPKSPGMVPRPMFARDGTGYFQILRELVPVANFYFNPGDKTANSTWPQRFRSKEMEGERFDGGTTYNNRIISMNHHRHDGDLGDYVDAVKHEIAHTLFLKDKSEVANQDPLKPDPAYVVGGITDYDHITAARGNRPVPGADYVTITQADVTAILNTATLPGMRGTVKDPHVLFRSSLTGDVWYASFDLLVGALFNQVVESNLQKMQQHPFLIPVAR